jgi:hypothetical protein
VVAAGTPAHVADIAEAARSRTAPYLARFLAQSVPLQPDRSLEPVPA